MNEIKPIMVSELICGDIVNNKEYGFGFVLCNTEKSITIKWKNENTTKLFYEKDCTCAELGLFR